MLHSLVMTNLKKKSGAEIFAARLSRARERFGVSQRQLGVLLGIDRSIASTRINQYERTVHMPHFDIARSLAKILSVPSSYFYTEDDAEADLLLHFHRLSREQKNKFIAQILEVN